MYNQEEIKGMLFIDIETTSGFEITCEKNEIGTKMKIKFK